MNSPMWSDIKLVRQIFNKVNVSECVCVWYEVIKMVDNDGLLL